jgi:hypothetical protein
MSKRLELSSSTLGKILVEAMTQNVFGEDFPTANAEILTSKSR